MKQWFSFFLPKYGDLYEILDAAKVRCAEGCKHECQLPVVSTAFSLIGGYVKFKKLHLARNQTFKVVLRNAIVELYIMCKMCSLSSNLVLVKLVTTCFIIFSDLASLTI